MRLGFHGNGLVIEMIGQNQSDYMNRSLAHAFPGERKNPILYKQLDAFDVVRTSLGGRFRRFQSGNILKTYPITSDATVPKACFYRIWDKLLENHD